MWVSYDLMLSVVHISHAFTMGWFMLGYILDIYMISWLVHWHTLRIVKQEVNQLVTFHSACNHGILIKYITIKLFLSARLVIENQQRACEEQQARRHKVRSMKAGVGEVRLTLLQQKWQLQVANSKCMIVDLWAQQNPRPNIVESFRLLLGQLASYHAVVQHVCKRLQRLHVEHKLSLPFWEDSWHAKKAWHVSESGTNYSLSYRSIVSTLESLGSCPIPMATALKQVLAHELGLLPENNYLASASPRLRIIYSTTETIPPFRLTSIKPHGRDPFHCSHAREQWKGAHGATKARPTGNSQ